MVSFKGFKKWQRFNKKERELRALAVGFNSTVSIEDDLHLVMLDYDVEDIGLVRESVKELQAFWHLADAYIYKTKNGFHAVFYEDQVPYERCKMIINYAKYVDLLYKYISRYHSHKTLRVAGKHVERDIIFKCVFPGKREPTNKERRIGKLKRDEHEMMVGMQK
ncbi:hypothetical protein GOV11_00915 [Candidatus Woesearchaeota archaeon]|nr:hypothetical protein [Candidatus Woesearchaeota archaeon]